MDSDAHDVYKGNSDPARCYCDVPTDRCCSASRGKSGGSSQKCKIARDGDGTGGFVSKRRYTRVGESSSENNETSARTADRNEARFKPKTDHGKGAARNPERCNPINSEADDAMMFATLKKHNDHILSLIGMLLITVFFLFALLMVNLKLD